ncbi:MAG: glucose-6-phosphate dehydrogenase, partial [Actinomycetota bacterium]|nr:glucose-6-phosphate dehydrogenase [Actinomycetota bacterium]
MASTGQEREGLRPDPAVMVLFGASGDLAKRKLIPGLYHLYRAGLMPKDFRIIGSAPAEVGMDEAAFAEVVRTSVSTFGRKEGAGADFEGFADRISYCSASTPDFSGLATAVEEARKETGADTVVFYLAVPPPAFVPVITALGESGLSERA